MAKDTMSTVLTLGILGAGAYFLYEWFFATPATAGASSTGTLPSTPAPPSAPPQSAFNTLTAIYGRLVPATLNDPNFTGSGDGRAASPYRWNTYLGLVWDGTLTGTSVPSSPTGNLPNLATVFPGVDLNQPMTAKAYWTGMSAYLKQNLGMSGVFEHLAGLYGMGRIAS